MRGPDGRFQPVEQVGPLAEPFVGGFRPPPSPAPSAAPSLVPPTPPAKDDRYQPSYYDNAGPSWSQSSHEQPPAQEAYLYATQQLANMTAIERSNNLRVAHMTPILQFMAGPLLRYDTVDADGVWHGAAMIVSTSFLHRSRC